MNLISSTLELQNGGWIIDDKTSQSLVYRGQFGGTTYRVRYQRRGEDYELHRMVEAGGIDKGTSILIKDEKAVPVISEIINQLKLQGISAEAL